MPKDQISLIFCFLAAVALGFVQCFFIRGEILRHFFSLFAGVFLAVVQYGFYGLISFAITSTAVYVILLCAPRQHAALLVFLVAFLYLSGMHIHRMIVNYMGWGQDPTNLQMILTCKLTSLAYAYQDGETVKSHPDAIYKEQRQYALEKLPSLLEYFSFACFFPGLLAGPIFEFKDYQMYIARSGQFASIPSPVFPALIRLFEAIFCVLFILVGMSFFPHGYTQTDEFFTKGMIYQFLYCNVAMVCCKVRYYAGFKFGEAGLIASGFSYNGKTEAGEVNWNRAMGVVALKSEFGETTKVMVENWNISTCLWLRRYVYNRIAPPQSSQARRGMSQYLTFAVSAAWHGFYPGYYLFFLTMSLLSDVTKMFYSSNFGSFPGKGVLKAILWVPMYLTGNFIGMPFLALGLRESLRILNGVCWLPHIGLALFWVFFKVTGLHRRHRKVA